MQCGNCGQELVSGAEFCGNCGTKIANASELNQTTPVQSSEVPQPAPIVTATSVDNGVQVPSTQPVMPPPVGAVAVPKQKSSGLSIAALVLGVVSLLSVLIFFVAIPLGVLAVILGAIGLRKGGKGMGIAGVALGLLGIVASVGILVAVFGHCDRNPGVEECKDISTTQLVPSVFKS